MSARSLRHTPRALVVCDGAISIGLHAMSGGSSSIALHFGATNDVCGLSAGFHVSSAEARAFAAKLIEHAAIADGGREDAE